MTASSLTQNEEQDIPSVILKTILDCMAQLFFRYLLTYWGGQKNRETDAC